jgi:hypothetical protein
VINQRGGAGSIKGNVKRKFFPTDGGVGLFSTFSPFRQDPYRWQRLAWAIQDVFVGFMTAASNCLAVVKRQQAEWVGCANHGSI